MLQKHVLRCLAARNNDQGKRDLRCSGPGFDVAFSVTATSTSVHQLHSFVIEWQTGLTGMKPEPLLSGPTAGYPCTGYEKTAIQE